jgi:protein subunit release factor B
MQNEKSQLQNREAAMRVLRARILAAQQEAIEAELSAARKSQVKSVDRSERIRTYNYPEKPHSRSPHWLQGLQLGRRHGWRVGASYPVGNSS